MAKKNKRTAKVIEELHGTRDAITVDLLRMVAIEGGRLALVAVEMPNGAHYVYGPENHAAMEAAFNGVSAYAAAILGPERALDIATGATVGRATDHQ